MLYFRSTFYTKKERQNFYNIYEPITLKNHIKDQIKKYKIIKVLFKGVSPSFEYFLKTDVSGAPERVPNLHQNRRAGGEETNNISKILQRKSSPKLKYSPTIS